MPVAVVTLKMSLPDSHSLKDKRHILKSLKDRIRNSFNVSVAEMDLQDVWQSACLAASAISPDKRFAEAVASKVVDFVRSDRRLVLLDYELEVY
jgi:hypothetical protein